ncbi:unnamed protein product, partial [Cyprideis torosa]
KKTVPELKSASEEELVDAAVQKLKESGVSFERRTRRQDEEGAKFSLNVADMLRDAEGYLAPVAPEDTEGISATGEEDQQDPVLRFRTC